MSCKCIDLLAGSVGETLGEISFTNLGTFMDIKTGATEIKPQPLRFKYYAKGKNGQFTKKIKTSFFTYNFCPFCGVKY